MGGLGRGDPLWIFFAFVFNAMWGKSTPTPPSHDPMGLQGREGRFLPPRPLPRAPCGWDKKVRPPSCPPVLCPRHCYAK